MGGWGQPDGGASAGRLSYANVMATVAVFLALGGSSYAALKVTGEDVRDGSLSGRDLRNGSLSGRDLRDNSVRSRDVRNGTLFARDFKASHFPADIDPADYYTKTDSDARFLAAGGKAADAGRLDGVDSTGFVQGPGSPGMWSIRRDTRANFHVNRLPALPGLAGLVFICIPDDIATGRLYIENTSGADLDSMATITRLPLGNPPQHGSGAPPDRCGQRDELPDVPGHDPDGLADRPYVGCRLGNAGHADDLPYRRHQRLSPQRQRELPGRRHPPGPGIGTPPEGPSVR